MSTHPMESRVVRYGDLQPCKTAFIDAHTPGSDQKENFTIIGGGVSESADQHVHIEDTPGFNIGAAGQPPRVRNSLHTHTTAEVFFVLSGRWRFFWGRWGKAGEVILEEGDIFDIPTHMFRGFENIGTNYGMIMAILGGDDAGGGVTWAPQVIQDATEHGLVLAETGRLYDTKTGDTLPSDVKPMPLLTDEELTAFPELPIEKVVPHYVARYWDLMALAGKAPAHVIGENALINDKPGFDVDFLTRGSVTDAYHASEEHEVLMPVRGHWKFTTHDYCTVLNPGDTCAVPPNVEHSLVPAVTGEASLYRVRSNGDPAGATWQLN